MHIAAAFTPPVLLIYLGSILCAVAIANADFYKSGCCQGKNCVIIMLVSINPALEGVSFSRGRINLAQAVHNRRKEPGRTSVQVTFDDNRLLQLLAGERNAHLKIIERQLDVQVHLRGNQFTISGARADVEIGERLLHELADLVQDGYPLYESDILFAIQILSDNINRRLRDIFLDQVFIASNKRAISPKSVKQKEYIEAIRSYDIVFGIGPAGTGKDIPGDGDGGCGNVKGCLSGG